MVLAKVDGRAVRSNADVRRAASGRTSLMLQFRTNPADLVGTHAQRGGRTPPAGGGGRADAHRGTPPAMSLTPEQARSLALLESIRKGRTERLRAAALKGDDIVVSITRKAKEKVWGMEFDGRMELLSCAEQAVDGKDAPDVAALHRLTVGRLCVKLHFYPPELTPKTTVLVPPPGAAAGGFSLFAPGDPTPGADSSRQPTELTICNETLATLPSAQPTRPPVSSPQRIARDDSVGLMVGSTGRARGNRQGSPRGNALDRFADMFASASAVSTPRSQRKEESQRKGQSRRQEESQRKEKSRRQEESQRKEQESSNARKRPPRSERTVYEDDGHVVRKGADKQGQGSPQESQRKEQGSPKRGAAGRGADGVVAAT
eukprot:gene7264-39702_t